MISSSLWSALKLHWNTVHLHTERHQAFTLDADDFFVTNVDQKQRSAKQASFHCRPCTRFCMLVEERLSICKLSGSVLWAEIAPSWSASRASSAASARARISSVSCKTNKESMLWAFPSSFWRPKLNIQNLLSERYVGVSCSNAIGSEVSTDVTILKVAIKSLTYLWRKCSRFFPNTPPSPLSWSFYRKPSPIREVRKLIAWCTGYLTSCLKRGRKKR